MLPSWAFTTFSNGTIQKVLPYWIGFHGSAAWMRVAQQGWAVDENDDIGGKFIMKAKNNIGNDEGGFRYSFDIKPIKLKDTPPVNGIEVLFGDHIKGRADDVMANSSNSDNEDPEKKNLKQTGLEFLTQYFAELKKDDYRKWGLIQAEANTQLGISPATLNRAKAKLVADGFIKSTPVNKEMVCPQNQLGN